jgi:hypothetical protein
MMEAYNLLVNYKNYNNNNKRMTNPGLDQVAFVTEKKRTKEDGDFPNINFF